MYSSDIQESLGKSVAYEKEEVAAYLKAGHPVLDVMESCRDVVSGQGLIRGGSSVLTDGEWVWRWDLAHYVRSYDLQLSEDFLSSIMRNSFLIPAVNLERLIEISAAVNESLGFRADPGAGPLA